MLFKCTKCGKVLELSEHAHKNCPFDGAVMTEANEGLVNEDQKVYILNENMV